MDFQYILTPSIEIYKIDYNERPFPLNFNSIELESRQIAEYILMFIDKKYYEFINKKLKFTFNFNLTHNPSQFKKKKNNVDPQFVPRTDNAKITMLKQQINTDIWVLINFQTNEQNINQEELNQIFNNCLKSDADPLVSGLRILVPREAWTQVMKVKEDLNEYTKITTKLIKDEKKEEKNRKSKKISINNKNASEKASDKASNNCIIS